MGDRNSDEKTSLKRLRFARHLMNARFFDKAVSQLERALKETSNERGSDM